MHKLTVKYVQVIDCKHDSVKRNKDYKKATDVAKNTIPIPMCQ